MSRKSFKNSFDDILIKENKLQETPSDKNKLNSIKMKELKATFLIRQEHKDKMDAISYMERKLQKDILAEALEDFFVKYENKNGEIQLPKK